MFTDNPEESARFRRRLIHWYTKHGRRLPWRGTTDPYRVWVSEIMLQQTTTKTVEGYFDRFITRFPNIETLAATNLDEVNRLWEGLGYYRRCAQMHRAAQEIVERFGGVFPDRLEDVRTLPGIGRYTAGAILSIVFDRRLPILEANTVRLHARLTALKADPTQREANEMLWQFAEKILPAKQVGRFNQALMDLGSLICTPKQPNCPECPVAEFCLVRREGLQDEIPYPKKKDAKEDRIEVAVLVQKKNKVLVVRHPEGGRWAGLWDFPRSLSRVELPIEISQDEELIERLSEQTGYQIRLGAMVETIKHAVTRYRITLCCFRATILDDEHLSPFLETQWVTLRQLHELPLNSTARKLCRHL